MKNQLTDLVVGMLEQEKVPVVICNLEHTVIFMNSFAKTHYSVDITRKSIKNCHNPHSQIMIDKVIEWFKKSPDNNRVFTLRDGQTDIYMVAIRDNNGALIGYTEKHENRTPDTSALYDMP